MLKATNYLILAELTGRPLTREEAFQCGLCPGADESDESLAREYTKCFRGVYGKKFGKPAYESVWRAQGEEDISCDILSEIHAFYRTCGIRPARREQRDYISMEFAFMAYLLQKQTKEPEGNWREKQKEWLGQHLAVWVPEFCDQLKKRSRSETYRRLAQWITLFIEEEQL